MSAPRANANRPLDWSARFRRDLLLIDAFYAQFGSPTAIQVVAAILDAAFIGVYRRQIAYSGIEDEIALTMLAHNRKCGRTL